MKIKLYHGKILNGKILLKEGYVKFKNKIKLKKNKKNKKNKRRYKIVYV